jgi:hypothetical protein
MNVAALLSQLNSANPMARLKRTVTIEKGTVESLQKAVEGPQAGSTQAGSAEGGPATSSQPMTLMEQIKQRALARFKGLHPEREEEGEDDDEY